MLFLGLLEEKLLRESASVENVVRAMDNHNKVIINYHSKGENKNTGSRIIEPVAYGLTSAGNPVIRAFQPFGDTTTKTPGWKFFRLDRISYWEETNVSFGKIPDYNEDELNADGDKTMSVVIKTYNSTIKPKEIDNINNGPKTKEKIFKTKGDNSLELGKRNLELIKQQQKDKIFKPQGDNSLELGKRNLELIKQQQKDKIFKPQGDKSIDIGKRNLELLKNPIKIDLDNNKKVGNNFNMYTNNTQHTNGPRFADQSYKPITNKNISGSVENGDISQKELDKARNQIYKDYSHELNNNEFDTYLKDNPTVDKNQKIKDKRWDKSADSRFLNRKNSNNREILDYKK